MCLRFSLSLLSLRKLIKTYYLGQAEWTEECIFSDYFKLYIMKCFLSVSQGRQTDEDSSKVPVYFFSFSA